MSEIDDGGPAFPEPMSEGSSGDLHVSYPGMTLRDYFAGQALIGIAWDCGLSHAEAADRAYSFADAMIAERGPRR